jgi:uncharacterized membrane protein YphA (DoxX/SURF4 family)
MNQFEEKRFTYIAGSGMACVLAVLALLGLIPLPLAIGLCLFVFVSVVIINWYCDGCEVKS